MASPFWEKVDSGQVPPRPRLETLDGEKVHTEEHPLVLRPARLPDPSTIPPRQWLYGTQLIRGFVTVLVAPGGTGKSAYAMVVGAAIAAYRKLLDEHVFMQTNVVILNLEDPMEELDRRLAAIMIRHQIKREELDGKYFMHSGEDRAVTMAAMGTDGFTVVHPDEKALTAEIIAHNIGLVIVDPYAESHTLEENNNPQMVKAAAAWRRIARATGCAVILIHHVRKGAVESIDSARGAKALTDSARVGLLLSPMSKDDAEHLGVPDAEAWQYVRLDNAKANLAPKAGKAKWFKLDQVELHNGTDAYPTGDRVAAVIPWEPPSVWQGATAADLNRILDCIAEPPAGWLYAPTARGMTTNKSRWAGAIIMDQLGCNEKQAQNIINSWLKTGLLYTETFRNEERKDRIGLRVNDTKRPTETA